MKLYKGILNLLILLFIVLYPILPSYGSINSDLILYLLALIQIIGFIFFKDERKNFNINLRLLIKDKIFLSLFLLNIVMYFSTLIAEDKRIALTGSIRFTMYIFIYYSIAYKLKVKDSINLVMTSFIGIATLSGIVSIIQLISLNFSHIKLNEEHRIASFLENPNNLGAYTILSIFIVLLLFLSEKNKRKKLLLFFSLIILSVNIILSQSRNALIMLFLGALLVAIIYDKRVLIFSILLPVILFIIPQSRYRIMDIFNPDQNSSRFKIWKSAVLMIKDNPYFGVGYDNFAVKYPNYIYHNPDLMVHGSYKALHPHNIFLKFQSELGILGSFFFILFIIITLLTLYKYINCSKNNNIKTILIGIAISFICFQFMNLIDCYYSSLKVILTLFILISIPRLINNNS
ncbi:O-antigen ligase family protein [Clostridium nigeriense]|uniref:O-antigen ligase family protein n=1 Tax=Clostridium nigeriense TaxID=1805470 RepID=UPI000830DFCE|nr:O-antigen ligase family protein [Clostridium nigeriense]